MKPHIELRLTNCEFENLANYLTGKGAFPAVLRRIAKKIEKSRPLKPPVIAKVKVFSEQKDFSVTEIA